MAKKPKKVLTPWQELAKRISAAGEECGNVTVYQYGFLFGTMLKPMYEMGNLSLEEAEALIMRFMKEWHKNSPLNMHKLLIPELELMVKTIKQQFLGRGVFFFSADKDEGQS